MGGAYRRKPVVADSSMTLVAAFRDEARKTEEK